MPHFARDTVVNFYPTTIQVFVDGVAGDTVTVPEGTREVVLSSAVLCKGLANDPNKGTSALPISYTWTYGVINGGANVSILSPLSSTTKLRILNPGDTITATLTVTTRYDTSKAQVTITVP
jgi:hypothetical protein